MSKIAVYTLVALSCLTGCNGLSKEDKQFLEETKAAAMEAKNNSIEAKSAAEDAKKAAEDAKTTATQAAEEARSANLKATQAITDSGVAMEKVDRKYRSSTSKTSSK